jgi:hypothetical protein
VYRADSENGTYTKLKEVKNATSYTDSSLEAGATGWYKVRAYYVSGTSYKYSKYSTAVSGTA